MPAYLLANSMNPMSSKSTDSTKDNIIGTKTEEILVYAVPVYRLFVVTSMSMWIWLLGI